jgi:tetratricopeptide (TPR) repeat protein
MAMNGFSSSQFRRTARCSAAFALAGLIVLTGVGKASGHEHESSMEPETLGKITFKTSCSARLQDKFETGVALLHSFEYDRATERFREISSLDPNCAMAYWGSAMSLYHQLWVPPSESDLAAGWQLIQKAESASENSPRESRWIEALAAFYKPESRTMEQRTDQYSEAMQKLHAAFPSDDEAAIFYALSLLAAAPPTDTELVYSRKAVAVLNEVLKRRPDHPGVAHYLIHACDTPALAQQGLAAAKRYASLAPSSPHALHMPSHIFTRLGLWNDDIASNLAAIEAAERRSTGSEHRLHPMSFLEYAYLQTGQDDKARAVESDALSGGANGYGHGNEKYYFYAQAQFPALLVLETRNWKAAEELRPLASAEPGYMTITYWAQAVGAGHLRDVAAAQAAIANFDEDLAAYRKGHPDIPVPPVEVRKNQTHAWLAFAKGDSSSAFDLMRAAIDYEDRIGKGEVDLPTREMYADMLLELNRPGDALEQYRLSLKSDPNRFNGLFGAARAAEALGQADVATAYYKQLLANCEQASTPGRAELLHARDFVARSSSAKSM